MDGMNSALPEGANSHTMRPRHFTLSALLPLVSLLLALPASAHHLPPGLEEIDEFSDGASFMMGVNHPLSGWDHLAVALLTGVVAAKLGARGRKVLPLAAMIALAFGMIVPALPWTEPVLLSSVAGAALVAWMRRGLALQAGAAALVVFQMWHGNAHALETPVNAGRVLFLTGSAAGTLIPVILGLALTILIRRWMPEPQSAEQPV